MSFAFDVPPPQQELDANPSVGDAELQHWIDVTRSNAERAVLAAKAADMAKHIADTASSMAISRARNVLTESSDVAHQQAPATPAASPTPTAAAVGPVVIAASAVAAEVTQAIMTVEARRAFMWPHVRLSRSDLLPHASPPMCRDRG
eukprot:gnl/TRDRNA2_/TRDRNA2_93438_c0_seq1.p2 gnl/TRDRNA2_/TRDRNA2_93438_c0~~gnl/TRDRNA2_/TRDRNA2_93438_c0_seq1.p2  ORF type:complete len:147 (-),score=33.32 gnl/TRDRNA2_/TRDRNA2_93438_c0_seq1:44-484(-)